MEQLQAPFILAITDHSKSHELAEFFRCPLIDENNIIQSLQKLSIPISSLSRQNPNELYFDLLFDILSQIVLTQIDLKLNVIINLLELNVDRLEKLVELENSRKAHLIIIGKIKNNQDDYNDDHILKVGVDDESFNVDEVAAKILNLLSSPKKDGDVVRDKAKNEKVLSKEPLNDHLHELVLSQKPRIGQIRCKSCSKVISDLSYECAECNEFPFHKSCAESSPKVQDFPLWITEEKPKKYHFNKTYKCKNCEEFSYRCYDCLLETNLIHGFLPPILSSECHQHFLNFIIMPFKINYQYKCCICDKEGGSISYKCYDCFYDVHIKCVLLSIGYTPYFFSLVSLLKSSHVDNLEILKALIYNKYDQLPLFHGATGRRISSCGGRGGKQVPSPPKFRNFSNTHGATVFKNNKKFI